MILFFLILLGTLHFHTILKLESTGVQFHVTAASESLGKVGPSVSYVGAFLVEFLEFVEIYLVGEVVCCFGCILPSTETSLVLTLHVNDADGVDALVHTDGVLPVVGALGVLAVILDAHSLVGTHVLLHYFLLDAAYLGTRSIFCVTHHLDAIAGEVSFGTTRITHGHRIVAVLITLERNLCPAFWVVWHVVLAVGCRTIGLRVGIDAEYREVAGLARPHPVICVTTELTHRLWYGEYQTQVGEVAVSSSVPLVALVERLNGDMKGRIVLLHLLSHLVLQRIDEFITLFVVEFLVSEAHHLIGYILLFNHKADEHILVRQFLCVRFSKETVEHIVVLHGRVASDSLETAMVVGKYQTVWGNDY